MRVSTCGVYRQGCKPSTIVLLVKHSDRGIHNTTAGISMLRELHPPWNHRGTESHWTIPGMLTCGCSRWPSIRGCRSLALKTVRKLIIIKANPAYVMDVEVLAEGHEKSYLDHGATVTDKVIPSCAVPLSELPTLPHPLNVLFSASTTPYPSCVRRLLIVRCTNPKA
jgi:hypothetical protein